MSCGKPQVTVIHVFRLNRILAFDHKDHNFLWMLTFIYSNNVHFPLLLSLFRNLTFPPRNSGHFLLRLLSALLPFLFPLPSSQPEIILIIVIERFPLTPLNATWTEASVNVINYLKITHSPACNKKRKRGDFISKQSEIQFHRSSFTVRHSLFILQTAKTARLHLLEIIFNIYIFIYIHS